MTSDVFFHWLTLVLLMMDWLILSKIVLLIFPMSDLEGFISRTRSEFGKFGFGLVSCYYCKYRKAPLLLSTVCRFTIQYGKI